MIIAPLQAFGLGDVIFCQTLANEWIAEGHKVRWGVMPEWIEGLRRAYPKVEWVDHKSLPINYMRQDEHDSHGMRVIPLRWSVELCKVNYMDCMKSKFQMFNKDWRDWRKGAMWQRDNEKELELMERLGLITDYGSGNKLGECKAYNLIHQQFGSDKKFSRPLKVNNGLLNVELSEIPGFSLFDWAMVYENATNIHAVSSSNIYIMEMLELKAKEIHLYKRDRFIQNRMYTEPHRHYDYILERHNYIFE